MSLEMNQGKLCIYVFVFVCVCVQTMRLGAARVGVAGRVWVGLGSGVGARSQMRGAKPARTGPRMARAHKGLGDRTGFVPDCRNHVHAKTLMASLPCKEVHDRAKTTLCVCRGCPCMAAVAHPTRAASTNKTAPLDLGSICMHRPTGTRLKPIHTCMNQRHEPRGRAAARAQHETVA